MGLSRLHLKECVVLYSRLLMVTTEYKQRVGRGGWGRHEIDQKLKFRRSARLAAGFKNQANPCEWYVDVATGLERLRVAHPPACREKENSLTNENPYAVLQDMVDDDECTRRHVISRKVRSAVRLLEQELRIKAVRRLPTDVRCGSLRDAVRSVFPSNLTEVAELSVKTSAKLETSPCDNCKVRFSQLIEEWKLARFEPQEVDDGHLGRFCKSFSDNLPRGWNLRDHAYIPNGHATLHNVRREGGNWLEGPFEDHARPELVFSSGKPRVVTLYSEFNTRTLTPLHLSLYSVLSERKWLLVGSPTQRSLARLHGGDWLSFDYQSATDNFKTAYVRAAVEILIDKGEGLSEEQVRCLRVLGELRLSPQGAVATRGQPMGSVMSFPLLCLFNKTVVDLALTDLLIEGKIQFKEWTGHRCLINGDDLLTRDVSSGGLFASICLNGSAVGMVVNKSKTMIHPEKGEINSTLFQNCVRVDKVNVAALEMAANVGDVLGLAAESTVTAGGFLRVVRSNHRQLARQAVKVQKPLSKRLREKLFCDRRVKSALRSRPVSRVPVAPNLFPVVIKPDDYALTRQEEISSIHRHVERLRRQCDFELLHEKKKECYRQMKSIVVRERAQRLCRALRSKDQACEEEKTLLCLARAWENKRKETLVQEDILNGCAYDVFDRDIVADEGRVSVLLVRIKEWSAASHARSPRGLLAAGGGPLGDFVPFDA